MTPEVLVSHRTFCGRDWAWDNLTPYPNPCVNVWLIVAGHGTWSTAERTYRLAPGDLFVQRLWRDCRGRNGHDEPLEVLWANVAYRDERGARLDPRTIEDRLPAEHRRSDDLGFVASLASRMIEARQGPVADRWLACLLQEAERGARRLDVVDEAIDALVAEVRRDPAKPWRVAGLARHAGLGVDAFARRFRTSVGVSPREFLVQARIDAAKAALRMTGDPIGAIAERLGFCDIYHFSRLFRQHAGRSPSAFRNGAS